MRSIIGLGEVLYDVLPEGAKLGGAPANFAYHASQFGFDVMAVSAVGNDALGDQALATFDKNDLKCIIPCVPYPTGTVNVALDEGGVANYTFTSEMAWDYMPFTPEMETEVHSTTFFPLSHDPPALAMKTAWNSPKRAMLTR